MKKNIRLFLVIGLIVLLIICGVTFADNLPLGKDVVASNLIAKTLEDWHYSQTRFNDDFSQRAFNLFVKSLDSNKRFLLKSDIEQLKHYQLKIDDEIRNGSSVLLNKASAILEKRVLAVQEMYQEILKHPFDFNQEESLETDAEKRDYCETEAELKEYWRKILKYKALNLYIDLLSAENKDKAAGTAVEFQPKLEKQAREKLAVSLKRDFQRLTNSSTDDQMNRYLNAITSSFDPHTQYYPPEKKEDFDIDISGTLEGIGALLREDGEYIKVMEIVPGSAAWKQKELQPGDLITKVGQGTAEPVDVTDMPINDVVKLIRGKKGTEVRLTVKKPDGRIMQISIIRDVVVMEETYAKSTIIYNEKIKKKIGYIYLPSFYHDFRNNRGRNSADDIEKEVKKVKAEKPAGIILDLRNNAGGSLDDVVEMSGLFIEDGPIVQVKGGDGRRTVLKDPDPGVVYDGPMVVLINTLSASASEILAAALQDYGRAVVVGGPTSFGKGTVQQYIDLDRFLTGDFAAYRPMGALLLTIQKFYRINGGSTQSAGVTADIPLPDPNSYLEIREKNLDYALPWDTVPAVPYNKWDRKLNLSQLKEKSARRVQNNKGFKLITDNAALIKAEQEKTAESLKLSKALAKQERLKQEAEELKAAQSKLKHLKVVPLKEYLKIDKAQQDKMKEWYDQINQDIYIEEATYIINDLISWK